MELYKRERYLKKIRGFYDACDIIKVITGIRRCGKSSILEMVKDELIQKGVKKEDIVFISLDKRGYMWIRTPEELEAVIDSKIKGEGTKYLFVDEIQNVRGFETLVNAYREEGNISIFITGSNSYLLSGELMTKLTGRYLEFEVLPLCFDEYLEMKKFYGKETDANLMIELNKYIVEGGFPRSVLFDDLKDKRAYTMGLVTEIFEKDIRGRVKIKDAESFGVVRRFVVNNFGSTMSVKSIQEELNKLGVPIARPTIKKYISALVSAKILYECDRFDAKSKRSLSGEKKYYLADSSLYFSLNTDNRINYGPCLENIVYLYAKSKGYSVSVGRIGRLECDFILRNAEMNYSYVQVALTILASKETEDREYRPLEAIRDNYPKYVITTDYLLQKRDGIIHCNLMDFISKGEEF